MSFAAFVFFARKHGFEFQEQGNNSLSFNYSGGRYYYCKIMHRIDGVDCGYIVLNKNDFVFLFGNDEEYLKDIYNCSRFKTMRSDGSREHCRIPESLWGNIKTEISPGKIINCLRNANDT